MQLLGASRLVVDGQPRDLSGRKPWGLLAYLVLEPAGASRRELAALLCPDADDPLAALRWSLLQLRRGLEGLGEVVDDGGLSLRLLDDVRVDAVEVLAGPIEANDVESLVGGELLEGFAFGDAPSFEMWLLLQRSRVASASVDALRWAATVLATDEPDASLRMLQRGIGLSPFDDALHELVIDVQVQRGDVAAASAYLAQVDRRYQADLGVPAPASLRRPLDRARPVAGGPVLSLDIAARQRLEMAERRFEAGDYEGGLETARRAASEAAASGDMALEARALTTLASILTHSVRGRDAEATGLLNRALQLAGVMGDHMTIADAEREVGYIAMLEAHYGAAEAALGRSQAAARAAGDDARFQRAVVYQALCRSDRCDYGLAEKQLRAALDALDGVAGQSALAAYARGTLARLLVSTDRASEGLDMAEAGVEGARAAGAMSLVSWPMIWSGEARRRLGDTDGARQRFEESYALGCEIADPCWESLSLRGLAGLASDSGDDDEARALLSSAVERCRSLADSYRWAEAAVLTDLVEREGGEDAEQVRAAVALSQRGPMPDLMARLFSAAPLAQTLTQTAAP